MTNLVVELSKAAFEEIAHKLYKQSQAHRFHREDGELVIDMTGLTIKSVEKQERRIERTQDKPRRRND